MQKHHPHSRRLTRIYVIVSIAMLLALLVLIPQRESLAQALQSLTEANLWFVAAGISLTFLTFFAAATAFTALAIRPVSYRRTVIIQLASGFATKLLPAGAGGVALNVRYLHRQKHTIVEAGSVVALNNLLGFAGHMAILLSAVIFSTHHFTPLQLPSFVLPVVLTAFILCALMLVAVPLIKNKLLQLVLGIAKALSLYQKRPKRLLAGFLAASMVTALYAGVLYTVARALGVELSLVQTLIVFSSGVIGATITPTPGGIGGAEAVLTATLVATGIPTPTALSIALGYRLLTYWLPILPGFFLFHFATRKGYV